MSKKKKILLLSDDLRMHSGIGTQSREFVFNTLEKYDWVQLGAAIKHPDEGKVFDLSEVVQKETGIKDASLKIYASSGYGNEQVLNDLLNIEKPDAILHFTDPRFWGWLYNMEHEVRQNIPIMYYTIWDDLPYPRWNEPFYESCDLLMGISKQTYNIVHNVVRKYPKEDWQINYVPHGICENDFHPIQKGDEDYNDLLKFRHELFTDIDPEFVVFYNNRNIRRKMPGDVVLSYKTFVDSLPEEKRDKCLLLFHTQPRDDNGTDLVAVCQEICPNYRVQFTGKKYDKRDLNFLYNCTDVVVNIASNEGFGLSSCEALMTGRVTINNVTGGLQDQIGFKLDGKHLTAEDYREIHSLHNARKWENNDKLTWGDWCKPVWPQTRSLMGSVPTPYIFDDRCCWEDVADRLKEWYHTDLEDRRKAGLKAREFATSKEVGMTAKLMGKNMSECIDTCFEKFTPRKRFTLYQV